MGCCHCCYNELPYFASQEWRFYVRVCSLKGFDYCGHVGLIINTWPSAQNHWIRM